MAHSTSIISVVAAFPRRTGNLAVILLLLPFFGLGGGPRSSRSPSLAGPPLVLNTDAGIRGVDPATLEAATGLGLTNRQRFWRRNRTARPAGDRRGSPYRCR
ncbi:MAG: hypothetical protein U0075_08820 [Thermomicrobiales bacterium]